jgi:hypothetical protein
MKLNVVNDALILDLLGLDFDYVALAAVSGCGGILVAWRKDLWLVSSLSLGLNHVTVKVAFTSAHSLSWCLTSVYRPQSDAKKVAFLDNLRSLRAPSLVPGCFVEISTSSIKQPTRTMVASLGV